jgi:hypothetical protein
LYFYFASKPFGPVPIENVGSIVPSGKIRITLLQGLYYTVKLPASIVLPSVFAATYNIIHNTHTRIKSSITRSITIESDYSYRYSIERGEEPAIMMPSGCIDEQHYHP